MWKVLLVQRQSSVVLIDEVHLRAELGCQGYRCRPTKKSLTVAPND